MSGAAWAQLLALIVLLAISTPLLGSYMAKVYGSKKAPGDRVFHPIERLIYRATGVNEDSEQRWTTYAISLLAFSFASVVVLYAQLRLQGHLPFNPDHMKGVTPALSFNTSVSFLTNTNWQNYSGESTMSHFSQMAGLAVHNFVSAAAGAAVVVALIRGLARKRTHTLGNFWVDMTRTTIRVLLPLAIVFTLVLISQGAVQNLHASKTVTTVSGTDADDPRRPDREPGGDQGDRRERRRALQRQLVAPLREPEPDHEHPRDLGAARHPVRLHVDVRRRWSATRSRASPCSRRWSILWLVASLVAMHFESNGNPHVDRRRREPDR